MLSDGTKTNVTILDPGKGNFASLPRIMLAGVQSGSGKTTFTCGLLQELIRRGRKPAAFKCGPDYIDPLFHSEVIGAKTGNLDLFFTDENTAISLLAEKSQGCDLAVLEGVMGYYDGLGGTSDTASAYHLAKATRTPVVMIVDGKGASLSVCALINGFLCFRPDSQIKAVLLNRCTKMQYALLKPLIETECGVEVLGFLPTDPQFALESRHLGLVTAEEVEGLKEKLTLLGDAVINCVNIPRLLALAEEAPPLSVYPLTVSPITEHHPIIAVARDKAFCFYYRENLELLMKLGAQLRYFSPLEDTELPQGTCALYLGGGYPELYGEQLQGNKALSQKIKAAIEGGLPTLAECGGFMYLHKSLTDQNEHTWELSGVLEGECRFTGSLRRFGYLQLTAGRDNLLCRAGEAIRAHEFHYFDSDCCGEDCYAEKPLRNKSWHCIHGTQTLFAGFPHLYFYSNPVFAQNFVKAADQYGGSHYGA